MAILYRLNVPYLVADADVAGKLREGFTAAPLLTHPAPAEPMSDAPDLINLNTCTVAELTKLKGIGIATANEIINGRPYESLEPLIDDPRIAPHIDRFTL